VKKPILAPMTLVSALRELRGAEGDRRPIVVDGARGLVPLLARELRAGGDASAVREGGSASGAAVLIWMGYPDKDRLREASLARIPIIGVTEGESLPYVLDTNLVTIEAGEKLPVAKVADVLARLLDRESIALAARLPVLREAVVDEVIRSVSRQNAMIAAAVWMPGVDMPILTLNQARMVLRIALAHGEEMGAARLPEVLGVVGAGFGLRAFTRQLLNFVPFVGWAAQGAVAYGGTRAIGEAARRRFADS
jgi:uncharacterized protein (DUF697 family)